jgi:hypothetical protein
MKKKSLYTDTDEVYKEETQAGAGSRTFDSLHGRRERDGTEEPIKRDVYRLITSNMEHETLYQIGFDSYTRPSIIYSSCPFFDDCLSFFLK